MLTAEQTQQLLAFFATQPTAVIATADAENTPAAAVVLFAAEDNLSIIFGTHPTRKYQNLMANPKASIVMTKDYTEVQLFGSAVALTGEDAATALKLFMLKHPEANQHMIEGSTFFRFTPSWARFLNTGVQPPAQWEAEV